jgi:hypothetical protein
MIKTENVTINGTEYVKSYSDAGKIIERNGRPFTSAIDPVNSVKQYVETDKPIPVIRPPKPMKFKPNYHEVKPTELAKEEKSEGAEASKETIPTEQTESTEPAVVEETVPAESTEPADPEVNEA